jgi:hypothetical protein
LIAFSLFTSAFTPRSLRSLGVGSSHRSKAIKGKEMLGFSPSFKYKRLSPPQTYVEPEKKYYIFENENH